MMRTRLKIALLFSKFQYSLQGSISYVTSATFILLYITTTQQDKVKQRPTSRLGVVMGLIITVPRVRNCVLSYVSCISLLTAFVCLVFLPAAPEKTVPVIVVVLITLVTGVATLLALIGPRITTSLRNLKNPQVGLEIFGSVSCLPTSIASAIVGIDLGHSTTPSAMKIPNTLDMKESISVESSAILALSNLITIFSCSTALVLIIYATLLLILAIHTHIKTRSSQVWSQVFSEESCPFVFPRILRFLQTVNSTNHTENGLQMVNDPQTQRLIVASQSIGGVSRELLSNANIRNYTRNRLHVPGCDCSEKLPAGPMQPDEYRLVHQALQDAWRITAETSRPSWTEEILQRRTEGIHIGHRRIQSAPVAMIRIPTENAQRRSLYHVSFEVA